MVTAGALMRLLLNEIYATSLHIESLADKLFDKRGHKHKGLGETQ